MLRSWYEYLPPEAGTHHELDGGIAGAGWCAFGLDFAQWQVFALGPGHRAAHTPCRDRFLRFGRNGRRWVRRLGGQIASYEGAGRRQGRGEVGHVAQDVERVHGGGVAVAVNITPELASRWHH